jgi:hypothetical protein
MDENDGDDDDDDDEWILSLINENGNVWNKSLSMNK